MSIYSLTAALPKKISVSTTFNSITRHLQTSKPAMSSINNLTVNQWMPEDSIPKHIKDLLTETVNDQDTTTPAPINHFLAFVQIISSLKFQARTGWTDRDIPQLDAESISDHMYRMSIISMLVPPASINKDQCVKIAIVHDIAECLVGDITPFAGIPKEEKHRREFETIKYLHQLIEPYNADFAHEMHELWLDYEEIRTPEARYVKDIDKLEMIQQAWEYEQRFGLKYDLREFYTARAAIKTKEVGELCDAVLRKREALIKKLESEKESA